MSAGTFVFVVCGAREHIDTLHYSLAALKKYSQSNIVVLTDSSRNEIPVVHETIVDVKTPEHFNHHQASIYLKTGIHRFLPKGGKLYCYLDTDVVALSAKVDDIFLQYSAPITFGKDHCLMDRFSPSAVKCNCAKQYAEWQREVKHLFVKYKDLFRAPENPEKKEKLLAAFDSIKKNKLHYAWITLQFWLAADEYKLDDDTIYNKKKALWHDKDGNVIVYENSVEDLMTVVESTTPYRCDRNNTQIWTIDGKNVFDCRCNHLQEQIQKTFSIDVNDPEWQHWNGGVFLFDDASHDFLDAWHNKTMHIFTLPEWKTRDQGTLIATVWEFGLNNHKMLPVEFNLIADYNLHLDHLGELKFKFDGDDKVIEPYFIHVYHHWADKNWDVWQAVEQRTGIVAEVEDNTINSLWIGSELSKLELLTINSFLDKGHTFRLWVYDTISTELPKGVILADAAAIIPRNQVFSYKNKNKYGHGKGSYAGFSDVFRYKMLYENGGWWVDMDVTCLKPFDFTEPYFFRPHHEMNVVGNVMKCPKQSELMKRCYEEAIQTIDANNTDWHKPIEILNKNIATLGLNKYIKHGVSNFDQWDKTDRFVRHNDPLPDQWYFIHWQNEEWRSREISKDDFYYKSTLAELMQQYGLYTPPATAFAKLVNKLRHFYYFQ